VILTTPHVETPRKEDRQLLIPAQFVEGSAVPRNAQYLECWHMLPIDIDGGMPIYDARERYAKFEHVGYTSHHHMHDGITQKFRMRPFLSSTHQISWMVLIKARCHAQEHSTYPVVRLIVSGMLNVGIIPEGRWIPCPSLTLAKTNTL
jgi:hypothetical protein